MKHPNWDETNSRMARGYEQIDRLVEAENPQTSEEEQQARINVQKALRGETSCEPDPAALGLGPDDLISDVSRTHQTIAKGYADSGNSAA